MSSFCLDGYLPVQTAIYEAGNIGSPIDWLQLMQLRRPILQKRTIRRPVLMR